MKPITKTGLTKLLRVQPGVCPACAPKIAAKLLKLGEQARKDLQRGSEPINSVSMAIAMGNRCGFQLLDFNGFNGWVLGARFIHPAADGLRPTIMLAHDLRHTVRTAKNAKAAV